jgi:uncharacterized damage-inducible protein DinB
MKKMLFFIPAMLMLSFTTYDGISKQERKTAETLLKDTEKGVFDAVKGLSDAQLKFKPAADRWSVEECLKHIAMTEQALWQMTAGTLKQPANPEKRADIKATDDQVVQMLEDRSTKRKTVDPLKPENTPFKTAADALASFKTNRDKLVEYINTTEDDLRNHVATMPVGQFDCYQLILFIGGHSNRHTQQIEEVKKDPNFPKN